MDPSEFEGTVEKSGEVLDAGALEHLFTDVGPKFTMIDLAKDMGDLYLSIYSLKELATKYEELSVSALASEMDAAALKLSELKEGYVNRRKVLTQQVKKFTADFLSDDNEDTEFVTACKEVIATFKKEFDGLSSLSKFSETAFLGVYKSIRDMPDPVNIASEGLKMCLKAHEILGKAQEQLSIANEIINAPNKESSNAPPAQQAIKQAELEKLQLQYEAEKEELKQSYLTEIVNLRTKHDVDMRNRELSLSSVYEKQQQQLHDQTEAVLAKKENEIASLLRSLSENQSKNQELDERARLLDVEMVRRRELEEKWRSAVLNISDLNTANQELTTTADKARAELAAMQEKIELSAQATQKLQSEHTRQLDSLHEKVSHLTQQLAARPPVDLTNILNSIASVVHFDHNYANSSAGLTWAQLESHLIEAMRKSSSEASQGRVKVQESQKIILDLRAQCASLQQQLTQQTTLTASLERDLLQAHQAVQASKLATRGSQVRLKAVPATSSEAHLESLLSGIQQSNRDPSASPMDIEEGVRDPNGSSEDLVAEGAIASSAAMNTSNYNGNDRILAAVQSQRDRYLKSCTEKDVELVDLKARFERLSDEQLQLRSENLELYRRLRVLRVSSGSGASGPDKTSNNNYSGSSSSGGPQEGGRDGQMRSRRAGDNDDHHGNSSSLDEKYMGLYEAEISPFRVEEIDRQQMMSRLNIFERGLAYVNRHILQDRWARHAFMVYLALVHVLALVYVSEVLNPQLIEEVDAHMKAKWSKATFEMLEHPDV